MSAPHGARPVRVRSPRRTPYPVPDAQRQPNPCPTSEALAVVPRAASGVPGGRDDVTPCAATLRCARGAICGARTADREPKPVPPTAYCTRRRTPSTTTPLTRAPDRTAPLPIFVYLFALFKDISIIIVTVASAPFLI